MVEVEVMKCDGSDWPERQEELRQRIRRRNRVDNTLGRVARQSFGPQVRGRDLKTVMAVFGLHVSDIIRMNCAQVKDKRTVRRWRSDLDPKNMPVDEFRALVETLQRGYPWRAGRVGVAVDELRDCAMSLGEGCLPKGGSEGGDPVLNELIGPDWQTKNWWKLVTVDDDGTIRRVPAEV